jgi:hypothetical protein
VVVVVAATVVVLAAVVVDAAVPVEEAVVVVVPVDVGVLLHDATATIDSSETANNPRMCSVVIVRPVIQSGGRLYPANLEPNRPSR